MGGMEFFINLDLVEPTYSKKKSSLKRFFYGTPFIITSYDMQNLYEAIYDLPHINFESFHTIFNCDTQIHQDLRSLYQDMFYAFSPFMIQSVPLKTIHSTNILYSPIFINRISAWRMK